MWWQSFNDSEFWYWNPEENIRFSIWVTDNIFYCDVKYNYNEMMIGSTSSLIECQRMCENVFIIINVVKRDK